MTFEGMRPELKTRQALTSPMDSDLIYVQNKSERQSECHHVINSLPKNEIKTKMHFLTDFC